MTSATSGPTASRRSTKYVTTAVTGKVRTKNRFITSDASPVNSPASQKNTTCSPSPLSTG